MAIEYILHVTYIIVLALKNVLLSVILIFHVIDKCLLKHV